MALSSGAVLAAGVVLDNLALARVVTVVEPAAPLLLVVSLMLLVIY